MKIKLLTPRVGPLGSQNRGDEIAVDSDTAARMVKARQAEIVRARKPEKSVKHSKAERASK